jgi:7tm Chemosensory receptor
MIVQLESKNYSKLSPEMREILQNLYQQVVHQPIRFTAFGFFPINLTLLASIMTGVVSYQVILIQFYDS